MTLFLLGLALAVVAWLLTGRVRRLHRPAPLLLLAAIYLGPAIFVALSLAGARDEARFRFALLGLGFSQGGGDVEVEIGGDREGHDLWISAFDDGGGDAVRNEEEARDRRRRLRAATLELRPAATAAGDETPAPVVLQLETGATPGHLGWRRQRQLQPVRALELQDSDRITVAGRVWTVTVGGLFGPAATFVSDDGATVELPAREGELPLVKVEYPILRSAPPGAVTYPLAWLDPGAGGAFANPRPEGFFYLLPAVGEKRLWMATVDPQVTVERDGAALDLADEVVIEPGTRLYALGRPRWSEDEFSAGGIRDFRSFRVLPARRALALAYDTPEIHVMRWPDLEELSSEVEGLDDGGDSSGPLRVHLSMGGWQLVDRSLYFRHAPLGVGLEALAILEIPRRRALWPDSRTFSAATPSGQREGRFGEVLWLGDERLAAVQIDVLEPPLWLAALALALALCKPVAARAAGLTAGHALVAGAVETLVALRLLLGYQAWALPPFKDEAYDLALIAWMALPWTLITIAVAPRRDAPLDRGTFLRLAPVAAGWVLSLVWCLRVTGLSSFGAVVWTALHVAALSVPVLRRGRIGERLARRFQAWTEAPRGERRTLVYWSLLAIAPGALRLLLLLFGMRESVQVNQRFALSLAHIPLALVLEALYLVWLWRRVLHRGRLEARDLLPALAFVVGTWVVPAFAVSDLGLALLNVPVFLFVLAVVSLSSARRVGVDRPWRSAHAVAVYVLAATVLVVAIPAGARLAIRATDAIIPDRLAEKLASERNYLRLLDFAYPQKIEEVARRSSEELAVMAAVLRTYTTGSFGGRGYLHTEVSPHIAATTLREHVPAVFVAAQWGVAGTVGVVLVLLMAAAAGYPLIPGHLPDDEIDFDLREGGLWGPLAALAALTFAIPSLSMILANYRLALFTGKNAYLLGLDSTADVLESWVLVALFAWGAAAVRDDQETGP